MMQLPTLCDDPSEALRRFDTLPDRDRLFLWMCVYYDAPLETKDLTQSFNILLREVVGGRMLQRDEILTMVSALQNAGWLDASRRCPAFLLDPLWIKMMCTYWQREKGQVIFYEFGRPIEDSKDRLGMLAPTALPRLASGQRWKPEHPVRLNSVLSTIRNLFEYPHPGFELIQSTALDEGLRFRWWLQDIRCAIAQQHIERAFTICRDIQSLFWRTIPQSDVVFPIAAAFPQRFQDAFFPRTSADNRTFVRAQILKKYIWYPDGEDRDRLLREFKPRKLIDSSNITRSLDVYWCSILVTHLILMGRFAEARQVMDVSALKWPCHRAWVDLLQGQTEESSILFEDFVRGCNEHSVPWISVIGCFLHFLQEALRISTVKAGETFHKTVDTWMNKWLGRHTLVERSIYRLPAFLVMPIYPNPEQVTGFLRDSDTFHSPVLKTFKLLCLMCLQGSLSPSEIETLVELKNGFLKMRVLWLAAECAVMLRIAGVTDPEGQALIDELKQREGMVSFVEGLPIEAPWKKRMRLLVSAIRTIQQTNEHGTETSVSENRLVWRIDWDDSGIPFGVHPVLQKRNAKTGKWTAGREISVKRLQEEGEVQAVMTNQDRAVAACVQMSSRYERQVDMILNPLRAVVCLIGHPHVYSRREPARRLELERGEPELVAEKRDGKVILRLKPLPVHADVRLVEENPNRYRVVVFNRTHLQISGLIGKEGIEIPETETPIISDALSSISGIMTVHSAVPFGNEAIERVDTQSVPVVQMAPEGSESLRLSVLVRPFGSGGPLLKAGKGAATLVSEIDGRHVQTVRRLSDEKRMADAIEQRLLTLDSAEGADGEWLVTDPEDGLQVLVELRELQEQGMAVVEWPKGERFKVTRPVTFDQMRVRLRSAAGWFEIDGELQIDEARVIGMKRLLDLMAVQPGKRFVRLEDGLFVALTETLRKRLDEISVFSERKGKKRMLHGLAAPAVEDVLHPFSHVEVDAEWQDHLDRIGKAMRLEPSVPSTLRAELREYQKEGFRWMVRLAHLGCGACLADDMGLGKTVQAIAMLLYKAAEGPSLVIAPMSVCANWMVETARFAPTLRVHTLHVSDRKALIDSLGPMDLLVVSYGLLHQEEEALASRQWAVIVLDEAQAIKNMATKRYQAAVRLQGGFKLITTGTPVENHLGEFYTLFQFLNPGLLGAKDRFVRRFVTPIEKEGDAHARQRLRKLIKPFILRRLKSQVLEELPPRTDIVLPVELKPEEIALYEAYRRKALERIERMDGPVENRRFEILAEILRLRQLCCHPKLVHPEFPDIGSKLEVFGEVVSELIDGGHKALVFSQFLGHLALIRAFLDKAGIAYRYLDGQTPAKQRQEEIQAFQTGDGDLFLISLKAGGLGLNLTAADYVIHMDPWWNPAVEDQASDRAHRIGQSRPVTVYRLVAQGTIEEKIVQLHAEKRELAESLLEGTDTAAPLAVEELLSFIREGIG